MTGAITLLGFAIGSPSDSPQQYEWRLPFVILLPILSFAVAKWLRHNDAMIGLLGGYCAAVEKLHWCPDVPAWHSKEHGFMDAALHYRVWSDHASIIITTLSTMPVVLHLLVGLGLSIGERMPTLAWFSPLGGVGPLSPVLLVFCFLSTLAGIAGVKILLDNATLRASFLKDYRFAQNEQGYAFRREAGPVARVRDIQFAGCVRHFWQSLALPHRDRRAQK